MIARIWNGRTKAEDLKKYTELMRHAAIADYQSTEGFIRLSFLRRVEGDVAYFQLITYWESIEAIVSFAGEDYELAKYYPEDSDFLLEFEERVTHFEVFAEEGTTGN